MGESRFHDDLKVLSKRPVPDLPSDFNEAVWSKIQGRKKAPRDRQENWFKALLAALPPPQWAVAGLALAIFAGWAIDRMTSRPASIARETRFPGTVTGEVVDIACYY
jgi:hypothetical protein